MKLLAVILGVCSVLSLTQALPVNVTFTVDTGDSGIQIRGLCNLTNQYCPHTLGSFCPQCAADGNFLPRQCSGSTGYCWCVNVITGEMIPNSRVPPGHPPPICALPVNPTDTVYYGESMPVYSSVQIRGLCNLISQECILIMGAQCPQCAADGNFLPRQCSGSTGYCWCVNVTTGEMIPNSRVPPGHTPPKCALPVNPTDTVDNGGSMLVDSGDHIRGLCDFKRQNCIPVIGAQCPQCAADGNFLPEQCSGSTGYCWCVNVITGAMIPNSMVPPGHTPPKCGSSSEESSDSSSSEETKEQKDSDSSSSEETKEEKDSDSSSSEETKEEKDSDSSNSDESKKPHDKEEKDSDSSSSEETKEEKDSDSSSSDESKKHHDKEEKDSDSSSSEETKEEKDSDSSSSDETKEEKDSDSSSSDESKKHHDKEEKDSDSSSSEETKEEKDCDSSSSDESTKQDEESSTSEETKKDQNSDSSSSDKSHDDSKSSSSEEDSGCPDDWTRFGQQCFIFINSPKTWAEAEAYCQFDGSNLASIHSYEENHFLQSLTRADTHNFPQAWIGGTDTMHFGLWTWSDGSRFLYENWSYKGKDGDADRCLKINYHYELKWTAARCSESLPFVCSKNAEKENEA
ncbi:serine-aspartate repeat-containing protein F-like isoform X2 [Oryzias latipes]|uniref:serine-aspartate repeat-containing protein F-like isoform X2 n=1 Tax=Oryzias latipes TaxID=8090 RepID=UPI000CE2442C|nr:serine-aspartate repeat-containing protein F-like isoform X2 [Oryzias latipes]